MKNFASIIMALIFSSGVLAADQLMPWPENPYYWSYKGEPVLLLGGSDDDNLFQWPKELLIPQLDRLKEAGGNVIRNTMSDRNDKNFEVYPFYKNENGLYDLNKWNPEYWQRFETMLHETSQRNIFVQIEIWDRFDYTDNKNSDRWQAHPYNPKNNVNYTYKESQFDERYPDHPGANKQPFFYTTPKQRNIQMVLKYQKQFVKKMLSHSLKYDHVLYCIDNETKAEEAWGRYWAEYIKDMAKKDGKRIYVTEMWDAWDLHSDEHKQTFDHPELYDFVDVSQNNHNNGQAHWDNFLFVKKYLSNKPRPMNTTKTYGADGNKFGHTDQNAVERFWRHVLGGGASVRFHRPPSGLGLNDKAVACLKSARKVESIVPIWNVEPSQELLSENDENEAYCASNKKDEYIVYFTHGGSVNLNISKSTYDWQLRWINIESGEWGDSLTIPARDHLELTAPSQENWVAVITTKD